MLLALVYGVFLVLVGITASALVAVASTHVSSAMLGAVVSRDGAIAELFFEGKLRASDLKPATLTATRATELETGLDELIHTADIKRIDVRSLDGMILFSSQAGGRGKTPATHEGMATAVGGRGAADLAEVGNGTDVLEFLPLKSAEGEPLAVVAIVRDAAPILASIDAARRDIMIVTVTAALLLAVVLLGVFRAAHRRIQGQQALLLDAERRDPLTELLNHGAVVALLTNSIEHARAMARPLGVALVDIDNFRNLNETHGHEAADEVLRRVAELLSAEAIAGSFVARYGPDEFLLVAPDVEQPEMEASVDGIRSRLRDVAMQFEGSEQLPVSISAGIACFPDHADSVTNLLSAAAVAVNEAKGGGGDAVAVARTGPGERVATGSFDVLRGLVIAVDTKDRYTKRHSEDVARYAVFLADRLGFDSEARNTVHVAGLLHDVGKIGIPDSLLRRPGKLTAEEFEVFKQHVALGDSIVRDVPDVDQVRAGIRHHHERWDGNGYLAGLEGEEIPLVARLLAVADAFSAMTTTRPYRKALSVEEALKRLGDAAGSQLQEDLVATFIAGSKPRQTRHSRVRWRRASGVPNAAWHDAPHAPGAPRRLAGHSHSRGNGRGDAVDPGRDPAHRERQPVHHVHSDRDQPRPRDRARLPRGGPAGKLRDRLPWHADGVERRPLDVVSAGQRRHRAQPERRRPTRDQSVGAVHHPGACHGGGGVPVAEPCAPSAGLWHRRPGRRAVGGDHPAVILPTPTPTPTRSPSSTPAPTPIATPKPPILPLPSLVVRPTPSPTPSEGATSTPEPSVSPGSSDGSGATGGSPRPTGDDAASASPQTIAFARLTGDAGGDAGVGLELTGIFDADFVWFVPAASVGVPGLLVILWVILQAFGALAWIPAVRRMSDESGDRPRRHA
jgi:diguanylate cyclase (GGDEF)-like protein